jgi:hypothetical protein
MTKPLGMRHSPSPTEFLSDHDSTVSFYRLKNSLFQHAYVCKRNKHQCQQRTEKASLKLKKMEETLGLIKCITLLFLKYETNLNCFKKRHCVSIIYHYFDRKLIKPLEEEFEKISQFRQKICLNIACFIPPPYDHHWSRKIVYHDPQNFIITPKQLGLTFLPEVIEDFNTNLVPALERMHTFVVRYYQENISPIRDRN